MQAEQPSLFAMADHDSAPTEMRQSRPAPPPRGRGKTHSQAGHPAVVLDVLTELEHGQYGMLDDSDTVVIFEDDDRVRAALDEDAIQHLLGQGYVERCPARERVSCHHGAIRKPVQPLRLSKRGRSLLNRWSALQPLNGPRS